MLLICLILVWKKRRKSSKKKGKGKEKRKRKITNAENTIPNESSIAAAFISTWSIPTLSIHIITVVSCPFTCTFVQIYLHSFASVSLIMHLVSFLAT